MGTRSKIIVSSKKEDTTIVLYKHWDGYPSENLRMFLEAFKAPNTIKDFKAACCKFYEREDMQEGQYTYKPTVFFGEDYGLQGDLEYLYLIDLDSKNVDLFGHDYGDEREHYSAGKIHPMKEVDGYREECKAPTKKKITEILDSLNKEGVKINGGEFDEKLVLEQLNLIKKEQRKLESDLYDLKNENTNNELNIKHLKNEYFLKMSAKNLKEFLELSGIKIEKVTKRKGPGEFNVYLADNSNYKESQGRTPWQHLNWLGSIINLDLDIK